MLSNICYIMIGLMCLKGLMLTKPTNCVSVVFVLVISQDKFQISAKICDSCHDLKQKAMSFNDVAIASVEGNDYRVHFWYISKDEAINLMKNSD